MTSLANVWNTINNVYQHLVHVSSNFIVNIDEFIADENKGTNWQL